MSEAATPTSTHQFADAGVAPMLFCLLVALTPLVFAAQLFEPYIAAKEILVQVGTAALGLVWLLTARSKSLLLTPGWIPLIALVAIGFASAAWSSHPTISLEEGFRLLPYLLLFGLALNLMRAAEMRLALTSALIIAGTIEAVYVLLQYFFGDPFFATEGLDGKWQTFGTLGNPNWAGEFLAVAALVTLGRLMDLRHTHSDQPWLTRGTLCAFVLMLAALAATLARGAWLAFLVAVAAFFIIRRRDKSEWFKSKKLAAAVLAGLAAIVVIAWPLITRQAAVNHLLNVESVRGRVWMWSVTTTMIKDAPLLGHGLGTYALQFPPYQARAFAEPGAETFLTNASFTSFAHNDYLQVWAELGLFGLLAIAAFVWLVLKRGRALADDPVALGCWAALISIFVNALFAFPIHLPTTLMLLAVLTGAVEATVCKNEAAFPKPAAGRYASILLVSIVSLFAFNYAYHRLSAESALWRAHIALQTGSWDEADSSARAAICHAPTRDDGYAALGRLHLELGNHRQALDAFDQALKLGFDADVYEGKAIALELSGQRQAAVATLNELIRLRPDLTSPRLHLARLNGSTDGPEEENHE